MSGNAWLNVETSMHEQYHGVDTKHMEHIGLTLVPSPLVLEPRGLGQHQRLGRPELGRRGRLRGTHPSAAAKNHQV